MQHHDAGHGATAYGEAGHAQFEHLDTMLGLRYAWDYRNTRAALQAFQPEAKRGHGAIEDSLPWRSAADPARPIVPEVMLPLWGSDIWRHMRLAERERFILEINAWTVSQLLHQKQGALLVAAQLVDAVPDIDSKLFYATQVADEARHVELLRRYLHERIGRIRAVDPYLKQLLDLVLCDSRWDVKLLGMQILVEGLASSLLGLIRTSALDPLLQGIASYVMADEARHIGFGTLRLREHYSACSQDFIIEREDFLYEAISLVGEHLLYRPVWDALEWPAHTCTGIVRRSPSQLRFRQLLFSNVVPALKEVGLLSAEQRRRLVDLGIVPDIAAIDAPALSPA